MKPNGSFKVLASADPIVVFDFATLHQVKRLVKKWNLEVQWFHRVERIFDESKNKVYYHIYDIIIPPQECSQTFVETGAEVMIAVSNEVKEKAGGYNDQYNEIMKSLTCWCHSHVNMGTGPSGTDNTQFKEQIKYGTEGGQTGAQVMFIFNKKDEYFCRIYDRELGVIFEHVPISVTDPVLDYDYVDDAIESKLTKKTYAIRNYGGKPNQGYQFGSSYGQGRMGYQGGGSASLRAQTAGPKPANKNKTTAEERREAEIKAIQARQKSKTAREEKTLQELAHAKIHGIDLDEYLVQDSTNEEDSSQDETLMGESSTDSSFQDVEVFTWEESALLLQLLEKINKSNGQDQIDEFIKVLSSGLGARDMDILAHLLFDDLDTSIEMLPMWMLVGDEECYEDSINDLKTGLSENSIDPPELLLEAFDVTQIVSSCADEHKVEQALINWFGGLTEEEEEEEESYTPLVPKAKPAPDPEPEPTELTEEGVET